MKKYTLYFIIIYFFLFLFIVSCSDINSNSNDETEQISEWEYYLFDSSKLLNVKNQISCDSFDIKFEKYKSFSSINNIKKNNYVLFRTKLPQIIIENPAVFIDLFVIRREFEAYLNKELIYKSDNYANNNFKHYNLSNYYQFEINPDFQNQYLYLLIYSNEPYDLGLGLYQSICLGNYDLINKQHFSKSLGKTIPGLFLIFLGIICFFLYFTDIKSSYKLMPLFGLMTITAGLHVLFYNTFVLSFINNNFIWYYVSFISLFLFPVFTWYFAEQIVGIGKFYTIRLSWLTYLAFFIIALFLDIFQIKYLHDSDDEIFALLLGAGILTFAYNLFKALTRHNKDLIVLSIGFILFALAGIIDLFRYFDIYVFDHIVFHYGLFFFIISVAYLIQNKYFESHNQLKKYAKELENLNQNLEKKVEERTAELNEKNKLITDANLELEQLNEDLTEKNHKIEDQNIELETLITDLSKKNFQILEKNTQLYNLNSELEKAIHLKDKFFSIIAHDLKNPIASIMLSSEMLVNYSDKFNKDELLSQHINLLKTTRNLSELLENLLNWARSQTGRISFEPEQVNCYSLVNSIFNLMNSNAEKKKIELINKLDPNLTLTADKNMLNTIFRNLISNGIKFTNSNGFVSVSANSTNHQTEFTVQDNGKGIDENDKEKLFRLDNNFTTRGTNNEVGTGLGLLLCKEFIEKHNGNIRIESEVNIGTKFIFMI
ncbi:MAG TPA: ATP-binding protein [Candidatus Kapabacteria bacterium]|nr:ATP-binding protein [Candidatus Kapabacteria bacterium]